MAFPTFEDITTTAPTASTVINMSLPATVNNDDLLVMIVGVRADTITTTLTGWTHIASSGGSQTDMAVFWRKGVSGDSGGTAQVNFDGTPNRNASGAIYRFSSTADPDSVPPEATLNKQDSDGFNKDCLSLTPSWGADDTTWIAAFFHRTDGTVSTYPTSNNGAGSAYTNTTSALNGTDAHLSGYAHIERNAASENPSDFVTSKQADWSTCTVAIPPSTASGGAFTLTADTAAYTYTGTAAALEAGYDVAADSGTYTYTGTSADLQLGYVIAANTGAYNYTGTAAELDAGLVVDADSGTYAYTGTAASLISGDVLPADSGTYTYSGTTASLEFGAALSADSGTYTYTGTAATLTFGSAGSYTLSADTAAYTYTGTSAELDASFVLTGNSGTYAYSGTAAQLNRGYSIVSSTGTYTYTGTNVDFDAPIVLVAETGTYSYLGTAATLSSSASGWTIQSNDSSTWAAQTDDASSWADQ